ncbi:beta-galactosidase GalA [Marinoscillum pacificum]|uniref:beta-galactosidase GalA n=1 Tax=Marinoscillum pacificum TaxID=392723 RepID=UPI00215842B3|nr:beta-galactosidase GalA [Marinoscillum pacificum]
MNNILRAVFILLLLATVYGLNAQQSQRKRINIDKGWKFALGHAADPKKDFNYGIANIFSKSGKTEDTPMSKDFVDTTWRELNVPHDWAVELPFVEVDNFDVQSHGYKPVGGLFPETSVGWYRKELAFAKADSGAHYAVTFDGVYRDARVWLNGFYLGNNESGYMGVTYDITNYIQFDEPNYLVVRVDASQYEGWFYEGAGIYRHVWLEEYNNLHFNNDGGVFVHTDIEGETASISVETELVNETLQEAKGEVYVSVLNREGKELTRSDSQPFKIATNKKSSASFRLTLENPNLWDLDNPYLYRVKAVLVSEGKVVDDKIEKFGIRTIEIDNKRGVLLNGNPIKVKGTNNHQDHAGVGSAMPDYLQYYRIRLLKEMGSNAYRASHNPPTPELLEACDSLGMLVMDETRLLNSSPEHMDQFEKLIRRDRNHPSIFMWCIGNEEGWIQQTSVGKRLALTMLAKQQELDPTRTSTYAADLANVYNGVNTVIPVRGFNYREFGMVPYHKDHPNQPIIGTEMGSTVTTRGSYQVDSIKGYLPDQDLSHPWWASLAEDWWPIAADNDWLLGGFIWTGFDYRGEPTPFSWPNVNSHFGVMDVCGFPKNLYYYYQSWWSDKDVLHISPHWNWSGKEGEKIDVWVNSNADKVELFLNGKSLGTKKMKRNSHLQWEVVYQSGELKAVATKGKRTFETSQITTSSPAQIKMVFDRKVLLADGTDATVVNVVVVDKNGREVPDANNPIRFEISGDADIIGVGNGDPSSHEPDKSYRRSLFNGKGQMILQAGESAGNIVVKATSPGLKEHTITLRQVNETKSLIGKQ